MTAFQLGFPIQRGDLGAAFRELFQQFLPDVGVSHLTAAEADGDLDPIASGQELICVAEFCVQITYVNAGGHTDLFDLDDVLILLGFLFPLGLLEAVLAVVHHFADRRGRLGGNFDQVKTGLCGNGQSVTRGHDPKLLTIGGNQANLFVPNILIDLMRHVANTETPPTKKQNMKKTDTEWYPHITAPL